MKRPGANPAFCFSGAVSGARLALSRYLMMKASKLLLFCSVFSIVASLDMSSARAADACFAKRLPIFQIIGKSETFLEKFNQVNTVCEELEREELMAPESIADKAFGLFAGHFAVSFTQGNAYAAFAKLGGSPAQNNYRKELDRIRQIPNPLERIRKVYALAASVSGSYDHETMGNRALGGAGWVGGHMPGHLIDHATKTGSIGVCREYAALLGWSLLQVARHPSSKSMALGPTDFSASYRYGNVGGGHAWVQAHLPQFDRGRINGFVDIDLDTTWYSTFVPLFPRRALSAKTRERAIRECHEIIACM